MRSVGAAHKDIETPRRFEKSVLPWRFSRIANLIPSHSSLVTSPQSPVTDFPLPAELPAGLLCRAHSGDGLCLPFLDGTDSSWARAVLLFWDGQRAGAFCPAFLFYPGQRSP